MIKEFNGLDLFRRKLWIAVCSQYDEISSSFTVEVNGKQEELSAERWNEWCSKALGVTIRAVNKKSSKLGYLVIMLHQFDKGSELVGVMTHESCHVSDFLQEDIGVTNGDTEINAHISGYVAEQFMLTWNEEKETEDKDDTEDSEANTQPVAE